MATTTCTATLGSLDELGFDCAIARAPGRRWVRLDDYAADPVMLDGGLRLAGRRFGVPEPSQMAAGWLTADIAASLAWPAAAMLLAGGPRLVAGPTAVHLPHPGTAMRRGVRIAPTAAHAPASPSEVAEGLVSTLSVLVEAVHRRTRRGHHALWATVTDMVAAAFHRVGDHLDRSDEARDLANQVIDGDATLHGGANWCDIEWTGGTERTRVRNICCLWYRTDGGDVCVTCPRLSQNERRGLVERRRSAGRPPSLRAPTAHR